MRIENLNLHLLYFRTPLKDAMDGGLGVNHRLLIECRFLLFRRQPGIPRVQIPCVPANIESTTNALQSESIGSDFVSPMEWQGAIDALLVEPKLEFAEVSIQNRPH
jgi:hypothetical protein